jgi:hypothetical protein
MIRNCSLLILCWTLLAACGTSYESPDSALDCGRQFIQAIFNGNFKRAKQLTLPDETNYRLLESRLEKDFRKRTSADKERLSQASIVINNVETLSDSVTVINFLNSYDSLPTILKIVRFEGNWKADLKYTYNGNF